MEIASPCQYRNYFFLIVILFLHCASTESTVRIFNLNSLIFAIYSLSPNREYNLHQQSLSVYRQSTCKALTQRDNTFRHYRNPLS